MANYDLPDERAKVAAQLVHSCLAALSDLSLSEMLCVVMDDRDALSRAVGKHVARAVGQRFTPESRFHARPAPRELVLEVRAKLGAALVSQLESPLADDTMRVLWLTPRHHHVIDVPIDAHAVAHVRRQLEDERVREDVDLGDDGGDAPMRSVAGTWMDPELYLPDPLPPGWARDPSGIDEAGVLSIVVDGHLAVELGAMEPPEGRFLFVVFRRLSGGRDVDEADARVVLAHLRRAPGGFEELKGMADIFGEGRVFAAHLDGPAS